MFTKQLPLREKMRGQGHTGVGTPHANGVVGGSRDNELAVARCADAQDLPREPLGGLHYLPCTTREMSVHGAMFFIDSWFEGPLRKLLRWPVIKIFPENLRSLKKKNHFHKPEESQQSKLCSRV